MVTRAVRDSTLADRDKSRVLVGTSMGSGCERMYSQFSAVIDPSGVLEAVCWIEGELGGVEGLASGFLGLNWRGNRRQAVEGEVHKPELRAEKYFGRSQLRGYIARKQRSHIFGMGSKAYQSVAISLFYLSAHWPYLNSLPRYSPCHQY